MTLPTLLHLIAGLALLLAGAGLLVRGAARLAARLGLAPLLIGLGLVACANGAPALAVGLRAVGAGHGDIAVGTVLGGAIFNLLFVLGLAALLSPLLVSRRLIRLDLPLLLGAGLLAFALAADGVLSRLDGALLGAAFLAYGGLLIRAGRRARVRGADDQFAAEFALHERPGPHAWALDLLLPGLGLLLLALGAVLLVEGAVLLARALGLSELVLGLTLGAVASALPGLATTLLAARKGERDLAAGNLLGGTLFTLLAVLGLSALLAPRPLSISPNALAFDFPVLLAAAVACLPIFFAGQRIKRWQGLLFLAYYLAYGLHLLLFASGAPAIGEFHHALAWYALPLSGLTLALLAARAWHRQRRR